MLMLVLLLFTGRGEARRRDTSVYLRHVKVIAKAIKTFSPRRQLPGVVHQRRPAGDGWNDSGEQEEMQTWRGKSSARLDETFPGQLPPGSDSFSLAVGEKRLISFFL